MSATGRGVERIADDAYATPEWAVHRMLEALHPAEKTTARVQSQTWLDAGAGTGAIVRACNSFFGGNAPSWIAAEQNAAHRWRLRRAVGKRGEVRVGDFLGPLCAHAQADAVVMNPPYTLAQEFIERALCLAPLVMVLTRLNYLESEGRADFLRARTPSVMVLPNRPSFAVSVTCRENKGGCGYREILPARTATRRDCPVCGNPLRRTTTDATAYAWLVWGWHPPRRLYVLASTPEAERGTE